MRRFLVLLLAAVLAALGSPTAAPGAAPPAVEVATAVEAPAVGAAAATAAALAARSVPTPTLAEPDPGEAPAAPVTAPPAAAPTAPPVTAATTRAPLAAAASSGPAPAGPATSTRPPTTWALGVGVDDYPGEEDDLAAAVSDARTFDRAMARIGVHGTHRQLLVDGDATTKGIRGAVRWLAAIAEPQDTVVLFLAGHVRERAPSTEMFVASDGGTIADTELAALLRPLRAERAWIVVATCYAGGFEEVLEQGRILTAAAPAHALSYENSTLGASYLVHYMFTEAILGRRADWSVQQAFAYAAARIANQYPDRPILQRDQLGLPLVLVVD